MKIPRPKTFYLHFNRIAMQRGDKKVWSVRLSDRCLHAEEVIVDTQLTTVYKPKSQQPRAFFKGIGYGYWVERKNGTTYLLISDRILDEIG